MKKLWNKITNKFIKKKKLIDLINNKYFPYAMILFFSILLILPSLTGQFHLGDDQLFHMSNIKVIADELPWSIFSKILPELANDFGFGVGIFYPPLPHIVGAIIYQCVSLFGSGLVVTETIVHFLIFFLSGITMYLLGKEIFKDNKKGLIAALFYITYNYFYVDVIVRDALNESFMFIFMPLVFLGLYHLFNNQNKKMFYICFVGGYIGLMYSHLVMSVYFTFFLIAFLLFFIKEVFKKENFKSLCLAAIMILIFTSTFTVPMIEHKISGIEYMAFIERNWSIEDVWYMPFIGYFTEYSYATGFDNNSGLIYANLNFIVTIFFIIALFRIFRKKTEKHLRKFLLAIAVFGILGIILNSLTFVWTYMPSTLLSIQFVWRLSQFVGLGFALVAAEGLTSYLNMFKQKYIPIALIIIFVVLAVFVVANNNKTNYTTQLDGLDISYEGAAREHFTTEIYQSYEDFWEKEYKINILEGNAEIEILEDDTPYMKFEITDAEGEVIIELPRIYYLGYTITDEEGNTIDYNYNSPGFISLSVDDGTYELKYTGTFGYKIAWAIKLIMIIGVLGYIIYPRIKKQIIKR